MEFASQVLLLLLLFVIKNELDGGTTEGISPE